MTFREKKTGKFRCICEVCGWKGNRLPTRAQADGQEKNHLCRRHNGLEVWPPEPDPIAAMHDEADTFINSYEWGEDDELCLPFGLPGYVGF